jgi:hypothetical protein
MQFPDLKCNKRIIDFQRSCARVVAILLLMILVSAETIAAEKGKQAAPPELTKLDGVMVFGALPDKRLIAVIDEGGPSNPKVVARYSKDGGHTWGGKEALTSLPRDAGNWSLHNVLVDHEGELHLFYQTDAKTAGKGLYEMRYDIYHVGSENGRKKWNEPVLIRKGYNGSMLSVIQLKSGRIVLPFTYLTKRVWSDRGKGFDAFTDMGRFSSGVFYSDDDGKSWNQSEIELKIPASHIGADGIIEPISLELNDGRVWLLLRTQLGRFFESFSPDGAVWSKPTPTSILASDSPPSLTRLKTGAIVMIWNNCQRFAYAEGGRHVLHGAISDDDGHTWQGYREVARNPLIDEPPPPNGDHGVAYTLPVLTSDGEIITPLSVGGTGGMWLLRLDPQWLRETSRRTDFSAADSGWSSFGTKGVSIEVDPEPPGEKVLKICKPQSDWPSAAVWNFPNATDGHLQVRLKLNQGFAGARIGLTDHFSVPFDPEDEYHNLYNLHIDSGGMIAGSPISVGEWHEVDFDWHQSTQACEICNVLLDGKSVARIPAARQSKGVNYIRVVSTAPEVDAAGLSIERVEASITK